MAPLVDRISPELALVDPVAAELARRLLPPPPSIFAPRSRAAPSPAPPAIGRKRRVRVAVLPVLLLSVLVAAAASYSWPANGADSSGETTGFAPMPSGGYVSSSGLTIRVADGLVTVTANSSLECLGRIELQPLTLSAGRTFAFTGLVRGSRAAATIHLAGSFISSTSALVVLRVEGSRCNSQSQRIVAHLS